MTLTMHGLLSKKKWDSDCYGYKEIRRVNKEHILKWFCYIPATVAFKTQQLVSLIIFAKVTLWPVADFQFLFLLLTWFLFVKIPQTIILYWLSHRKKKKTLIHLNDLGVKLLSLIATMLPWWHFILAIQHRLLKIN